MDTLTALNTRVSVARLTEPGPSADQVRQLLAAAIRAPDHGMLRPWRFLVLEGEERERLGDIMEWRLLRRQPEADQCARDNIRNKALRAPTIIVAVAEITEGHKVPAWEQVLAVGAAVQNIMVAARGRGLDTCPQAAFTPFHRVIRDQLAMPANEILVCGMALGYADPDAVENRLTTEREPIDVWTTFLD